MLASEFVVKNMKAWIHPALPQQFRLLVVGVMVWGIFSWHTLGPLVPIEHPLNATAYLSIVADHVHPFMTTVYPSSDDHFQQDNAPCHKAQIISDWFLEHENEFTLPNGLHGHQFPFMGTRTASPRGRYGERPQRDSVWRYIWKNTTCWPATAHDVTTGVPQYKCRREDTSSAFSSSLTGLFEACRVNLVRVQFSNSTMASTSKAFRKCVDPCPRYLTPDDTHDCCVFCLGMEHARDVLEGAVCVHCERLSVRKLSSRLSLFSRKEGQPSASRDSRPTVAEARRRMKSWGSQLVVADKLERDRPLFARRPRTRVSCWIVMMRSFWHH